VEGVVVRLLRWAAAALEKSSNQPALPHAIIALNACSNNIRPELWDVNTATTELMKNLGETIDHNHDFREYAQYWRKRNRRVDSVRDLLESYYSSIRVVRIPEKGRPNLIQRQIEKLSKEIERGTKQSRERKTELRMLLDADEIQPYLQGAFDHFAQNLEAPFDFVKASFANNPIPQTFGGNILKLAIQAMKFNPDQDAVAILEELSSVVASCIMLDAARHVKGTADKIFPQYISHIDSALENFCDRHWRCEYRTKKGERCVNVFSGHSKGHQSETGRVLAAGDYEASISFDTYHEVFENKIYYKLLALREQVKVRQQRTDKLENEEHIAAEIHRQQVLPGYLDRASNGRAASMVSHTVCFCCLIEPPEHALPCGHIICTQCLKAYGKAYTAKYLELASCPMERDKVFRTPWRVQIKHPSCGIRVLTLDG
jgi:hypothetical protein